ncbi:Lcl domain-containing protein [Agarivorans sp. QJM3NY_33]|uniref:Lcl domain-containing protein n=1 Tax=Agarivorans sp. QJM3NY_33 TaxID=3421432 RepID=UPI003D7E19D2
MQTKLSIAAAVLLISGCGGSDGGSDISAPTYQVSGTITALAAQGDEKVCADLNGDFLCAANEPSAISSNGSFSISSTNKAILDAPLVVELDTGVTATSHTLKVNAQSVGANALLVAPGQRKASGNQINAITTLVAAKVASGAVLSDAIEHVKQQLHAMGLSATDELLNEGSDSEYAQLEQNLLLVISAMDKSQPDTQLGVLSSNLSDYQALLLAGAPSDNAVSQLLAELSYGTRQQDLNDTGLQTYFSDGGDTTNAPVDYPGQDADFGHDSLNDGFHFTKLDENGAALPSTAAQWSCVRDERSGLIWENKTDEPSSPQFKDRLFVYQVRGTFEPYSEDLAAISCEDGICSTEDYVEYLNEQKVCGLEHWRLPKFAEFYDLIDFGESEQDELGDVYGLTRAYFPRQSIASDLAAGEVWTSDEFFTEYEDIKIPGSRYILAAMTRGIYRGTTYPVAIYSDQTEPDLWTSYQLPIRLVSKVESN